VIRSVSFTENNGAAELAVNTASALTTSVSADRKTITLTPVAQVAQVASPPPPPAPVYGARRYFAVVDASHGGSERGAALNDDLAEKDITLIYARRIRQELEARGISTLLLRDGDMTMTLDQRANAANLGHPAIYIAVHAASQGTGVRVYTALLPAGNASVGPFIDWNVAQSGFEQLSHEAASAVAGQFQAKQVPVKMMTAALRPLNNIRAAAIAVEVAPEGDDVSDLTSVTYQQLVAFAVAAGVAADRGHLEAGR
jgi:N-acetylmuramoyl-L-alanine amidase